METRTGITEVPLGQPVRVPVNYRWDALNWEFLKLLAENAAHAQAKYKQVEQYTNGRLEGEKSPINHAFEHLRAYIAREPHDAFDGGLERHLAAIAYNVMMEYFYLKHGGPTTTDAFVGGSLLDYKEEVQEIVDAHRLAQHYDLSEDPARNIYGQGSGPFPGRDVTAVQTPDKTVFLTGVQTAPPEDPKSILSRFFSSPKKAA